MRNGTLFGNESSGARLVSTKIGTLNERQLRTLLPTPKDYKLSDGGGLYLFVMAKGYRWWRFKFQFNRRAKQMSLGVWPQVSLKEARERRDEARRLALQGIDPIRPPSGGGAQASRARSRTSPMNGWPSASAAGARSTRRTCIACSS